MISFANSKINIGLNILYKREDGFHALDSLFYPIPLCDIVEVVKTGSPFFTQTGIAVDCDIEKNLAVKAYRLLEKDFKLQQVSIHLHKIIPMGAGMGGGSSDGAFALKTINDVFSLGLSTLQLKEYAAMLGSDCPFFIDNKPSMVSGRGEVIEHANISLKGYAITIVKPSIHISTVEAYQMVKPSIPSHRLSDLLQQPISEWKENVVNDFEKNIFVRYPLLANIKETLYQQGAMYASMSGSGSAIYGIFQKQIEIRHLFPDCFTWQGLLD